MIDYTKLINIINENNTFLITSHVNPDADAIGSEMAFYYILKELGKTIYIINHSETPYNLAFLDPQSIIQKYNPEKHDKIISSVQVIAALDFNRSDRVVRMRDSFLKSKAIKICIDHHLEPEGFEDYLFSDPSYSSTGHVLYEFIKTTGIVKLSYDMAFNIYAAIMTDTGSFRFERTTPEIHRIAAELLEAGVDPNQVYDGIYDQSKFSKIKLMGRALNSLKTLEQSESISYMVLSQKDFIETGAVESDTDGFVSFALSIENVVLGLLFIELKEGFKVSFRSKGKIPVNKLAAEFGGGGHMNAAGARRFDNMNDLKENILNKSFEYYNNYKE